ncbi:hypothetical protein [Pengzhenrongella sicca]|uniref:PH domain-containing protein n=1 Tax=Pengzhenrongella sicca TaxID=2819238 RepID=A0A8A4ZGE4_9MICO|nr:hypothetical protein [Pengzhenrongella sicca]QTE31102.1 hypothetical protein J4E96_09360 [Pengzhenrongella sicca]
MRTHEVIARSAKKPLWLWAQIFSQALLLIFWANKLREGDDGAAIVMTVLLSIVVILSVAAVFGFQRVELVLTDDAVLLRRRWHPITVARADIRAVRGDIPGRPSWSASLIVQLDAGQIVTLPTFGQTGATLVPTLQEWAGVGETPTVR